ncbi:hypothetical protein Tco_0469736 [Tanacetum coccineum]
MPRGTTQVVTRGASNDCVSDCAGGRYEMIRVTQALEAQLRQWHVLVSLTRKTPVLLETPAVKTGTTTSSLAVNFYLWCGERAIGLPSMGIEQANQITWTELKRLLTNKYCPRTEIRKMEEELYNLIVKGNDLKPYVRRFRN